LRSNVATFRLTAAGLSVSRRAAAENPSASSAADEGFEVGERFHEINFKRSLKVIPVFQG